MLNYLFQVSKERENICTMSYQTNLLFIKGTLKLNVCTTDSSDSLYSALNGNKKGTKYNKNLIIYSFLLASGREVNL